LGFWGFVPGLNQALADAPQVYGTAIRHENENTDRPRGLFTYPWPEDVSICTRNVEVIGTVGASGGAGVCDTMVDEFMELVGSRADVDQLGAVLVRGCGCGCTYRERELVSRNPDCGAVRGLRDRRFVLGLLFARSLRPQLESEEWLRA
jgi:hypothetical protein